MNISRDSAPYELRKQADELEAQAVVDSTQLLPAAYFRRLLGEFERAEELLMEATTARVRGARRATVDFLLHQYGIDEAVQLLGYIDEDPETLLDLAELHRSAGRRVEALRLYQRATDAGVPQAAAKYSEYLIDYGDFGQAQQVLDQSGDRDPGVTVQRMRLALKFDDVFTAESLLRNHFIPVTVNQYAAYMLAAGKPAEAVRTYEEAARLIHSSFLINAGQVEERFGNPHKAEALYRSAAAQLLPALPALAGFLSRTGREAEGDQLLIDAVEGGASHFMLLLGSRFEDRSLDLASDWFNRASEAGVEYALQTFAGFKERHGFMDDAIDTMTRAVDRGELGSRIKLARMLFHHELEQGSGSQKTAPMLFGEGSTLSAELHYSLVMDEPNGRYHISELADFFVECGRPDRAVMLLKKAVSHGDLALQLNVGAILENDGRHVAAQKAYEKAVHWGLPNSFERLGRFYSARGRHLDAAHQFALEVETGNATALLEVAKELANASLIEQADQTLLSAVTRRVPNAVVARGDFLLRHKGYAAADAFLEEQAGEKIDSWARLTRMRVSHGFHDEAKAAFAKVVQLGPKDAQVRELTRLFKRTPERFAGPELS